MAAKIVLTGGPCAGKTRCLRAIRDAFGEQVVTVPEAATLLLESGFPPPGHPRIRARQDEWIRAFQSAILSLQQALEEKWEQLASGCGARLIVCDRGVLDGAAYWPEGRSGFLRHFGLSLDDCFSRYRAVFHLQSLAQAHPHLYGRQENAIRYENVAEAARVEQAVRAAWVGHPGLLVVVAREELQTKIAEVLDSIRVLLART